MFSTTTIASSTNIPMEKISANSDTRFSVNPYAHEANKVAASVNSTAMPTTSASRLPIAIQQLPGDIHRIRAGLLGDRQGHCGELAACLDLLVLCRRAGPHPHIFVRLVRTILHFRDVTQEHRLAIRDADHQVSHLAGVAQKN